LSRPILEDVLRAIDSFVGGLGDIAGLQSRLEADASALDRRFDRVIHELRSLDADLEEIRFGGLRDEQRSAAILRLDPVRESLLAALADLDAR
jgi:hypothetical protein